MLNFSIKKKDVIKFHSVEIDSFVNDNNINSDNLTVDSFGEEWEKFNYFSPSEIENAGKQYFDIVDEGVLNENSIVLDAGCGSGRWSRYVAQKVKFIEAMDPSKAIFYAKKNNLDLNNVRFIHAGIENIPFEDESFDFIFSLGVLHHIPDTNKALSELIKKLKIGGSCLIYLYYKFDNKNSFYKFLFYPVNLLRKFISKRPKRIKFFLCDSIAILIYLPLKLLTNLIKYLFKSDFYKIIPLSYYHDKSFNIIRNDSLDRFGTPLEQRFSKDEIRKMLVDNGAKEIIFSNSEPYWHVLFKKY